MASGGPASGKAEEKEEKDRKTDAGYAMVHTTPATVPKAEAKEDGRAKVKEKVFEA